MIYYLRYGTLAQERMGYPALGSVNRLNETQIPTDLVYTADFIFWFEDGKTEYYKDRYYVNAQYTSEEQLSIALRAIPIGRKS